MASFDFDRNLDRFAASDISRLMQLLPPKGLLTGGETQARRSASKAQNCRPDVVGLQVIKQVKTGQYGRSSYCGRKIGIEIPFRV